MNITIKNVKHSEFASHETHCFEASIYIDGKRFCSVSNDGHGGCDMYDKNWKEIELINSELKQEDIDGIPNNLEMVVGNLVNEWLVNREIKTALRKVCYSKDGEIYTLKASIKPTLENLEKIQKCSWWKADNIILNTLPIAEARTYF